jgi:hypothetical protein
LKQRKVVVSSTKFKGVPKMPKNENKYFNPIFSKTEIEKNP